MVAVTNNQSALATPAVKASKPSASRRKGRVRFVRQKKVTTTSFMESDDLGNFGFRFLFKRKGKNPLPSKHSDHKYLIWKYLWFKPYSWDKEIHFNNCTDSDTSGTSSAKEVKTISHFFQNNLISLWTFSPVSIQILFCCIYIWCSKSYCQLAKLQISKTSGIPKCPTNVQNIWINIFTSFAFIDVLTQRF